MALSKKKYVEEAKARVKEKMTDIDDQRDIIVSFIDDIVAQARTSGDVILSSREKGTKFSKLYRHHMPDMEEAWNKLFVIRTSLPDDTETDISESDPEENSTSPARDNRGSSSIPLQKTTHDLSTTIKKEPEDEKTEERQAKEKADEKVAQRKAEEKAAQRKAEEKAAQRKAEEKVAQRKAEEKVAQRKAEEKVAQRKAEEKVAQRKAEEKAAQRKAEEKVAQKKAEENQAQSKAAQSYAQEKADKHKDEEMPVLEVKCKNKGQPAPKEAVVNDQEKTTHKWMKGNDFAKVSQDTETEKRLKDRKVENVKEAGRDMRLETSEDPTENITADVRVSELSAQVDANVDIRRTVGRGKDEQSSKVHKLQWPSALEKEVKSKTIETVAKSKKAVRETQEVYSPQKVVARRSPLLEAETQTTPRRAQSPVAAAPAKKSIEVQVDRPTPKPVFKPSEAKSKSTVTSGKPLSTSVVKKTPSKQQEQQGKKGVVKSDSKKAQDKVETKEEVNLKVPGLNLKGQTSLDVYVLLILNPHMLWISPQSPELDDLQDELNHFYGRIKPGDNQYRIESPAAGMYCCCKFSQDGVWYRTRILEVLDKRDIEGSKHLRVSVLFIDYGNKEERMAADVLRLDKRFSTLPCHAVPCTLANVAPAAGGWKWSAKATMELGNHTLSRESTHATLTSLPDCPLTFVELFASDQTQMPLATHQSGVSVRNLVDVGKLLVQKGVARTIDNHHIAQHIIRFCSKSPTFNPVAKSWLSEMQILQGQKPDLGEDSSCKMVTEPSPPDIQRHVRDSASGDAETKDRVKSGCSTKKDSVKSGGLTKKMEATEATSGDVFSQNSTQNTSHSSSSSKSSIKEVIKQAEEQIKLAKDPANLSFWKERRSGSESGSNGSDSAKFRDVGQLSTMPKIESHSKSTAENEARCTEDVKDAVNNIEGEASKLPMKHSTPKPCSSEVRPTALSVDGSSKGKVHSTVAALDSSHSIKTSGAEETAMTASGTATTSSSWSDGWKNQVADEAFEHELEKKMEALKVEKQVSDDPSPPSSNLDVSQASNNSAKKLRTLGLPKKLPKSCAYSDSYGKIMATSDEENDTETIVGHFEKVRIVPETDGCIKFMLSHVDSPSKFYVHQVSEETGVIVEGIMKGLQDYMAENRNIPLKIFQGACAGKFTEDNQYYRALILETEEKDGEMMKVRVFYVDYGNSEWLTTERLFYLAPQFLVLPPQAVPCTLADVQPLPEESDAEKTSHKAEKDEVCEEERQGWTKEAVDMFTKLCTFTKVLVAYIMTEAEAECVEPLAVSQDSPLPVLVVDTTGSKNLWMSFELVQEHLAVHRAIEELFPGEANELIEDGQKERQKTTKDKLSEWDPMAADYLSVRNSYKVDIDDAGVAAVGYNVYSERSVVGCPCPCQWMVMRWWRD